MVIEAWVGQENILSSREHCFFYSDEIDWTALKNHIFFVCVLCCCELIFWMLSKCDIFLCILQFEIKKRLEKKLFVLWSFKFSVLHRYHQINESCVETRSAGSKQVSIELQVNPTYLFIFMGKSDQIIIGRNLNLIHQANYVLRRKFIIISILCLACSL